MADPIPVRPEAVTAAAVAIHDADCPDRTCNGSALGECYRLARIALEAAAPHILADAAERLKAATADEYTAICTETVLEAVAAERERIRQLARQVDASYAEDPDAAFSVLREFADLLEDDDA